MIISAQREQELKKTGGRILIVDDEPAIRNILARILTNQGHQPQAVSNGKAALALLLEKPYDLLVADLKMTGISGIDLFKMLQQKHPEMANRTVFITGDVMSEETSDFLISTGRPYLAKPFTPQEFLETIDNALGEIT